MPSGGMLTHHQNKKLTTEFFWSGNLLICKLRHAEWIRTDSDQVRLQGRNFGRSLTSCTQELQIGQYPLHRGSLPSLLG